MKQVKDFKIMSLDEFKASKIWEREERMLNRKEIKEKIVADEKMLLEIEYNSYLTRMNIALEELKKANDGSAQSQYTVGTFFQNEDFFGVDDEEAVYYYELAAKQNHPYAALQLALRLKSNESTLDEAKRYYDIYKNNATRLRKCDLITELE